MRAFVGLVSIVAALGCHRWTHLVRSEGIPRSAPIAVEPVRVTANTIVRGATLEDGLTFAKDVASEVDDRITGMLVHDGATVRHDARLRLAITITRVHTATGPWLPSRASITALVELWDGGVVRDAIVTKVVDPRYPTLGAAVSRDVADWVAWRRSAW